MAQSKLYAIEREPRFGLDIVVVGAGVCHVLAPETKGALKELGVLQMLEGAYNAGLSEGKLHGPRVDQALHQLRADVRAFVSELSGYTRLTPQVVNHDQVLRLVAKYLPDLAPTVVPADGEGTHGVSPNQT